MDNKLSAIGRAKLNKNSMEMDNRQGQETMSILIVDGQWTSNLLLLADLKLNKISMEMDNRQGQLGNYTDS